MCRHYLVALELGLVRIAVGRLLSLHVVLLILVTHFIGRTWVEVVRVLKMTLLLLVLRLLLLISLRVLVIMLAEAAEFLHHFSQ